MEKTELKNILKEEGFRFVYEWKDTSTTFYPEHSHQDRVALYIIGGELTFDFSGEKVTIKKGARFDVPAGKLHTAVVGREGCEFIVGEMIDGDS